MSLKRIVSFGYKYGEPVVGAGVIVVDVRKMFNNPYHDHSLRDKTGRDLSVRAYIIMTTPNFAALYAHVKERVLVPGAEVAYIGCMGGRHRSVFLAETLGVDLKVIVEHRDLP